MGGLYGSEYWTYLLPRRVGAAITRQLTDAPFTPLGTTRAVQIGLLDAAFGTTLNAFHAQTRTLAETMASDPQLELRLAQKRARRAPDERIKPLQSYRREELTRAHECFFGADPSYHDARRRFLYKIPARHRPPDSSRAAHEAQRGRRAA